MESIEESIERIADKIQGGYKKGRGDNNREDKGEDTREDRGEDTEYRIQDRTEDRGCRTGKKKEGDDGGK